ncbi:MAG: ABC transporter substrate-binding protein [Propioniciclava sp.]
MTPTPRHSHSARRKPRLMTAGAVLASAALALTGCSGSSPNPAGTASDDPWRQFEGTAINFISENTAPSAAIAANLKPFEDLTGITVNVQQMELDKVVENVKLDMSAGTSQYQVIYADPHQVLAPLSDGLLDLTSLVNDDQYPAVEGGLEDFIPAQLQATGRYLDEEKLYALPYDAPTLILHYRKDLFEKYGEQMQADLGFDPVPSDAMTWEQYYEVGVWFNENVDEVTAGIGVQAKQHDSLQADFSNVLWAYGGDYFEKGQDLGVLGDPDPGAVTVNTPEAIAAATFYKKLLSVAHPSSTGWDWTGLGDAFSSGEVAMAVNWHEFAAGEEEALPDQVGYALVPKGPARRANNFGGTGIGINANASGAELGAAWLFVNWATSPETQIMGLGSDVGGGTPTRTSLYEDPQIMDEVNKSPSKYPNIKTAPAVLAAWETENIGLRPKLPQWVELNTVIFTELSKMITQDVSPEDTMNAMQEQMTEVME